MASRRLFITLAALLLAVAAVFVLRGRSPEDGQPASAVEAAQDISAPEGAASARPASGGPSFPKASGSGQTGAGAIVSREGAAPPRGAAVPQAAPSSTPEDRRKAREERRKKARAALEDFLRDELRMNEEQVQAYKDIQTKHDEKLKAARASNQDRTERRQSVRSINQEQSQQLRELVGNVDYARIQDFERRQREQYREEHPDTWDGRRGRGR